MIDAMVFVACMAALAGSMRMLRRRHVIAWVRQARRVVRARQIIDIINGRFDRRKTMTINISDIQPIAPLPVSPFGQCVRDEIARSVNDDLVRRLGIPAEFICDPDGANMSSAMAEQQYFKRKYPTHGRR